ncbi:response regulator [Ruminiclostridium herbifermentans]|uniref:Stage 0 sporulation protein A homolog n=1 Tax=Ruminiclostridium herbifermentans TaxID=2488810 RepID=A0A4U7JLQ7_9FIRM|nr:response regulator [Ruminiclostridium herbifermentans]QNU68198.1 response regulator [Ruminiclostridium herbifermentans]
MYKVMIVDDEFYFREALKISLPWEKLGFEICGEAKNGKEAIKKIEELKPDITIVDINMPIMDGLEFAKNLKESGIETKILILTGHSEFSYAKQAVSLGVYNYLLKPVNEEELANCLCEMKMDIQKEANLKIELEKLKEQVKENIPLLKEKFLNDLIQGNSVIKSEEVASKIKYLKMNIPTGYYQVALIEVDYDENLKWTDEDKQLWLFSVKNIASEILQEYFEFEMCYDRDDRLCIIVCLKGNEADFLFENTLERVKISVHKYLKFTISIGIGNRKSDIFDVASSFKEAIIALKNKLTIGSNKVILYSSVDDLDIKHHLFTAEHRSQLLLGMRTGNGEEIKMILTNIFRDVRGKNIHCEILYVVCVEIVSVCMEIFAEMGISFKEIYHNSQMNIFEEIQLKQSIDEMEGWIKEIFSDAVEYINKNKNKRASQLIEKVKKYISDNYQNDELDINIVAKSLFVNYGHLCFVFKRDTGITINEYITEFRIKKAKELIDNGEQLVFSVAKKVGYADANYFGKCFKKFYGLTPSKYIENVSQKRN